MNDTAVAKWFKHTGCVITGLSKAGIKEINNGKITRLVFPAVIGGVSIASIGRDVTAEFAQLVPCVDTVVIPSNVHVDGSIGDYDKKTGSGENKIKTLIFESDNLFYPDCVGTAITDVVISSGEKYKTVDGIVFSKDGDTLVRYPAGKITSSYTIPSTVSKISQGAFQCCKIDELIIPKSVTYLGSYFAAYSKIKRLDFGTGVTEIPDGACINCPHIEQLIFHEGLETIGKCAFEYCGAARVVFPASLRKIDEDAFAESKSMFTFQSDDVLIEPHAFHGCITEGTNYSVKIEGKMQRCGYTQYNRHDYEGSFTRDQAIDKLEELAGKKMDIPESMLFVEIKDMIKAYETIQSAKIDLNALSKMNDISSRCDIESVALAAVKVDNFALFYAILNHGFRPTSHMFFYDCYRAGEKWSDVLFETGIYGSQESSEMIFNKTDDVELCRYLLKHGADPNMKILYNQNAIQRVVLCWGPNNANIEAICRMMLEAGAEPLWGGVDIMSLANKIFTYGSIDFQKYYVDFLATHSLLQYHDEKGNGLYDLIMRVSKYNLEISQYFETRLFLQDSLK